MVKDEPKLFLDDHRKPPDSSWTLVKNFEQFCAYFEANGCPGTVSFDHDLAWEHYPFSEETPDPNRIPYDAYKEKTGLHAARWMVERGYKPQLSIVHSFNPVGAKNIAEFLASVGYTAIVKPYRGPQ